MGGTAVRVMLFTVGVLVLALGLAYVIARQRFTGWLQSKLERTGVPTRPVQSTSFHVVVGVIGILLGALSIWQAFVVDLS